MKKAQRNYWLLTGNWMSIVKKTDEEDEILQRWLLHMQQINVEDKDEGDEDESEQRTK